MKDKNCMHHIMRMSFLLPSMKLCHISNAVPLRQKSNKSSVSVCIVSNVRIIINKKKKKECLMHIICLCEDVLAVLSTGFWKSCCSQVY